MMLNRYKCKLINVETAFLEGDLEEEIFMDVPDGYKEVLNEETAGECLRLERPLYGLVQAARQFWKKAVEVLKSIGFVGGQADPCLMSRTNNDGTVHIIMYVDDFLCVGDWSALTMLEKELKESGLVIKVTENLTDYLSCEIKLNDEMSSGYLRQPHLIISLKKSFGELVKSKQKYKTPGMPGQGVLRPESEEMQISSEKQKIFRSGVGMLPEV